MIKQDHKTRKGDRVRLKGQGQDSLYEAAYAGAEGWVGDQRHDHLGYPEIFVKWDKTHWTYNGEDDGWTMESHFDILEDEMDHKDNEKNPISEHLLNRMAKEMGYDLIPRKDANKGKQDLDAEYERIAEGALEAVANGTAFIVIAVSEHDLGYGPTKMAEVFNGYRDEISQYLLEANISRIGSKAHERVISKILHELMEEEK